jgi:FkbM family methyltransferase
MSFISYAQNLEDVMLYRALKHIDKGFYIDVGALYPDIYSVTKAFYDRGWQGINIEPIPEYFNLLQSQRSTDINLNLAISNKKGHLMLHDVVNLPGLATANNSNAEKQSSHGHKIRILEVPCTTLDDICEENQVETVHFLKIDVEGLEKEVLEGFSFKKVHPWIIVIEANEPNSTKDISSQWESLILNNNYECVYYDGLNRFYIAVEHRDLQMHFRVPPNVFDDYIPYAQHLAQQLAVEEQKRKELLVKQLTEKLTFFQEEIADLRGKNESLNKQLVDEASFFQQELIGERKQKESLAKQLAIEKACLEQISSSYSWCLTAPLRAGKNGTIKLIHKILNLVKGLIKCILRFLLRFNLLVRIGSWILKSQPGLRARIGALRTQPYGEKILLKDKLVENESEIFDNLPESARSIYLALKDAYNNKHNNNRKI